MCRHNELGRCLMRCWISWNNKLKGRHLCACPIFLCKKKRYKTIKLMYTFVELKSEGVK